MIAGITKVSQVDWCLTSRTAGSRSPVGRFSQPVMRLRMPRIRVPPATAADVTLSERSGARGCSRCPRWLTRWGALLSFCGALALAVGEMGPGGLNLASGAGVAFNNHLAALLVTTNQHRAAAYPHSGMFMDMATRAVIAPLTKWNAVADRVDQIPHLFRTAFRAMTTGRPGAAHIGLPYDLQKQDLDPALVWAQAEHVRFPAFRTGPDPDSVAAAADALLSAKSPAFVCGGGVAISGAQMQLRALAEVYASADAQQMAFEDDEVLHGRRHEPIIESTQ